MILSSTTNAAAGHGPVADTLPAGPKCLQAIASADRRVVSIGADGDPTTTVWPPAPRAATLTAVTIGATARVFQSHRLILKLWPQFAAQPT
jgi:hypothetical protein